MRTKGSGRWHIFRFRSRTVAFDVLLSVNIGVVFSFNVLLFPLRKTKFLGHVSMNSKLFAPILNDFNFFV
jgi:hypothetical protein